MRWWQRRPLRKATFERQYAARSNISVERLRAYGRFPKKCDCGEEGCEGWQMAYPDETPI